MLTAVRLPGETCCQLPCSRALQNCTAAEVGRDLVRSPRPTPCSSRLGQLERVSHDHEQSLAQRTDGDLGSNLPNCTSAGTANV